MKKNDEENSLVALFEQQVQRSPDATALYCEGDVLTYRELNEQANRLAHYLDAIEDIAEQPVGICMERGIDMVVAIYAVLKAGGAYVPLDTDSPAHRIEFMVKNAGIRLVLAQDRLAEKLTGLQSRVIFYDREQASIEQSSVANPGKRIREDFLAYVLHTSGSTGQPKGVMIEHRSIINRLTWVQKDIPITERDKVLQKAPYTFDVSVRELFWPLQVGAQLVIAKHNGHKDSDYMVELVEEQQITVLHFVPSMMRLFIDAIQGRQCSCVERVIVGGEVLRGELVSLFFEKMSGELYNMYGPTEAAVDVTTYLCDPGNVVDDVPIGWPNDNVDLYILDEALQPVPAGEVGEICLGGVQVGRGYINQPELTNELFIPDPFSNEGGRLYKTGDLGRILPDGCIAFLGRKDFQVKIRGLRIELGEIENNILQSAAVSDCAVIVREDEPGIQKLAAYIVGTDQFSPTDLRRELLAELPAYMIPDVYVQLESFPRTVSGKIDRNALPEPSKNRPELATSYQVPVTTLEKKITDVWAEVLALELVGIADNFFELGGNSLSSTHAVSRLKEELQLDLPVLIIFEYSTIKELAEYLENRAGADAPDVATDAAADSSDASSRVDSGRIAIVGMSGRFPGADSPDELWENIISGVESISTFEPGELEFDVAEHREVSEEEKMVAARSVLDDVDQFDAHFFGIFPKEAQVMDPQQRLFLECSWEALESAGYDPETYPGKVSVLAGLSMNTYMLYNLCRDRGYTARFAADFQVGSYHTMMGNDKDHLATRVAYKLNLKGASFSIQSACSTSLVAINQACVNLRTRQCDMALAGGASITFPQRRNYLYTKDGMVSADGTCRAFDADACGTVFGSGVGVIALKRLEDALKDGDPVLAIISGSAVNNDGTQKAGYTAPSITQQADVIRSAHEDAGVSADSISYIEAHGTGTPLGDPIEIEALTRAFRTSTDRVGYCAVGSVKPNIGHLDCAAGVAGVIKTVQALKHQTLPRLLHFKKANPHIDFENSPFYPLKDGVAWESEGQPRRAGVSAFGVGGTNAHVVLEEAPERKVDARSRDVHSIVLSAKTPTALQQMRKNLGRALEFDETLRLADVGYTLHCGRKRFDHRLALSCRTKEEAVDKLLNGDARTVHTRKDNATEAGVAFVFPGQGAQYPGMGNSLYENEPVYKAAVDECAALLEPLMGEDIRDILFARGNYEGDAERINQTAVTQPCIFITEYALSRLWMSWGIKPSVVVGHSIGEYVAAVLSGVFTLDVALQLLAERARLIQSLPGGSMLAVRLPEAEVKEQWLNEQLSIAAVNSLAVTVVSGTDEAVQALADKLEAKEIYCKTLATSHGFHSPMMEPILDEFTALVNRHTFNKPEITWISTLTGKAIANEVADDPSYWSKQIRNAVRFADAMEVLLESPELIVLEVGPGGSLASMTRQHPGRQQQQGVVSSLSRAMVPQEDYESLMLALGDLWSAGAEIDWNAFYEGQNRLRVKLPTYPFERKRFWVEPPSEIPEEMYQESTIEPEEELPDSGTETEPEESNRVDRLTGQLRELIYELSGIDADSVGGDITFAELGFDSLFLTQMSVTVQKRFRVKVAFRQLMNELATVDALAAFLDEELPEELAVQDKAKPARATGKTSSRSTIQMPQNFQSLENKAVASRFGAYKAVETGENSVLTEAQQQALESFFENYLNRTKQSKAYTAEHRGHFADPRAVSGFRSDWKELVYPFVCNRSKGSRLWDIDGNEYIDITNGFGVTFFGHAVDFVNDAVREQLDKGYEIGPQAELAGQVSKLFCEFVRMERATFCNTGSEAVMAAMRLARTVNGKDKVVYFGGGYHGTFDQVLVSGNWMKGEYRSNPIAPGIPEQIADTMIVLDYGDPVSLEVIRKYADDIAAVLVEPVQSRNPRLRPVEFLHELRDLTRECDIAFIMDEVVTGFRTHPGGIQARFGIEADLATYGKVVGGGLPIGILAGKKKYMDALDGGMWQYGDDSSPEVGVTFFAGTFVRHPLALSVAWSVLNYLKENGEKLQLELDRKTARFVEVMNAFYERIGAPIRLSDFSSWFMIEYPSDLKQCSLFWYMLRAKGIHVWEGRPCFLTLEHGTEEFEMLAGAFAEAAIEMQVAGILPGSSEGVPLPVFEADETVLLTEAEKEVFYSAVMGDDANCAYNEACMMRLKGTLDKPALKFALQRLLDRHPALRSRISLDGARQVFPESMDLVLDEQDFQTLDSEAREQAVSEAMRNETDGPFDLHHGPLIRFRLLILSENEALLLLTAHHIVCDGWSWGMLIDELSHLYTAGVKGAVSILPQPMSFSDYARMLNSEESREKFARAEAFWVDKYSTPIDPLALPVDHPRPPVKTFAAALAQRKVDAAVFQDLKKHCPKLGGTMFSTLLAAFGGLMHRITGQNEIAVGIPSAGQTSTGVDSLVGHCLNFLPMRLITRSSDSFGQFAEATRDELLEAYEHQDYTFGSLLKKLDLPHDASRIPLVSVMFNIDRMGMDHLNMEGLEFEFETNPKQFTNFELFFNLVQTDTELTIECEFNTDLFERASVEEWLKSFENIMKEICSDGDVLLKDLPFDSPAVEVPEVPDVFQSLEYPEKKVHELVAETAAGQSEKTAVKCGAESLTYAELDQRANRIAHELSARGVRPGDLVGIFMERSVFVPAAMLGVLKAGAAYVPMDPEYPAQRIQWMIEDADLKVMLTDSTHAAEVEGFGATALVVAELGPDGSAAPVDDGNLSGQAYVIFTSGSTGRPKGVQIPHRALINFLVSMQQVPGMNAEDTLLAVTTLSFDISGLEMFLPLISGGCLVIASRDTAMDGRALLTAIEQESVTIMQATPITWKLMLEAGWTSSPELKVLCGGEAFPRDLANQLVAKAGEVWNMYGPTETTIWSSCDRVETGGGSVSIGRPIANTSVYIVDQNLRPVPAGQEGELVIGGDGLAIRYLGNTELTNEKFTALPDSGERIYRTGDLARYMPDGRLDCLGRIDNQVKLRGFRIELGEIETALSSHDAVKDAVVITHESAGGNKRLVGYVVPDSNKAGTTGWRAQWEALFSKDDSAEIDPEISGWSDEGSVVVKKSTEAMLQTLEPFRQSRVLEIGCGGGHLLQKLSAEANEYWATDFAVSAIDSLKALSDMGEGVKLLHREATDFEGIPEEYFDTIILNSVVQYFPGPDYLSEVVEKALSCLKPDGVLFVGGLQSCSLLECRHTMEQLQHVEGELMAGQLRERIDRRLAQERTLAIDPVFFESFSNETLKVEILFRGGSGLYDAALRKLSVPQQSIPVEWDGWSSESALQKVISGVKESGEARGVGSIPNALLDTDVAMRNAVLSADTRLPVVRLNPETRADAITPEQIRAWADTGDVAVAVRPGRKSGSLDVVFMPKGAVEAWMVEFPAGEQPEVVANQPLQGFSQSIAGDLKKHVSGMLPDYMVPSAIMLVEEFPLTPNGKIDRKVLPEPMADDFSVLSDREIVAPKTATEKQLVDLWKEALGQDSISIQDSFFDLGGDSILSFQITAKANAKGLKLTPRLFFQHKTIEAMAGAVDEASREGKSGSMSIKRVSRDAYRR